MTRANKDEFKKALQLLRPDISEKRLRMLKLHYLAPEHTISAAEVAREFGSKTHDPVNRQYGGLAKEIRGLLGQPLNGPYEVLVLASIPEKGHPKHLHWVMHPELVTAIQELGWFDDAVAKNQDRNPSRGVAEVLNCKMTS